MKLRFLAYGLPLLIGGIAVLFVKQAKVAADLSFDEINQIAESTTVVIESQRLRSSGVLVKRNGDQYTVLTAAQGFTKEDPKQVFTSNGKQFAITQGTVKKFPGVDLAILEFSSKQPLSIIEIGDSTGVKEGNPCYISGFPATVDPDSEKVHKITQGLVIANTNLPITDGYNLSCSNKAHAGMIGGPVLDRQGQLIGIHVESTGPKFIPDSDLNTNEVVETALTFGVSANKFLSLVPKVVPSIDFRTATPIVASETKTAGDQFLLGRDKFDKGDFVGALVAFNKAIALDPDVAMFYLDRGKTYKSLQNYTQAIADYDKAISMNAEHAIVYGNRASVFTIQKKYSQALKDYKKALELDPNDARLYFNRGSAYSDMQDYPKAIADYDQAITLDPDLAEAYGNRGFAYYRMGDKQNAKLDLLESAKILKEQNRQAELQKILRMLSKLDGNNSILNNSIISQ